MSENRTDVYGYNIRNELVSATKNSEYTEYQYQYDDIGNRISSFDLGTNRTYIANNLNQYTSISNFCGSLPSVALAEEGAGEFIPHFDDDGNQTLIKTATGIWQVQYNGENRPVLWECVSTNSPTPNSSTPTLISMSYDRMGRRVTKNNQCFVYDGYLQIADSSGNVYIWDPTEKVATCPLAWNCEVSAAYYVYDGNKNVSDVIAFDGTLDAHYEYAPFGAVTAQRGASVAANPWRFSSEFAEDDTATVYYNYRHYEPVMGRWMSRDRIEERGGVKLYAAFENDPVCQFDSEGDVVIEAILAAFLLELANHYVCYWYAHDGLDNEADAYKHCMVSCRYSKCTSILNGKLIAAINTFLGGVVHEIVSSNNSWEGAIDDIKSNLIGIVHSFIPFESCEKACECERGRWNR